MILLIVIHSFQSSKAAAETSQDKEMLSSWTELVILLVYFCGGYRKRMRKCWENGKQRQADFIAVVRFSSVPGALKSICSELEFINSRSHSGRSHQAPAAKIHRYTAYKIAWRKVSLPVSFLRHKIPNFKENIFIAMYCPENERYHINSSHFYLAHILSQIQYWPIY